MQLKQLLTTQNPIVHKTWPIGEYLTRSSHLASGWRKLSHSKTCLTSMPFDIEEAILNDDGGYFELTPHRPSYEEVANILGGGQ